MFKLRVLIADDQMHYREVLMSRLQGCAAGVFQPTFTEVSSPEEAVLEAEKSQISGHPFDLILLDINFAKLSEHDGHWAASEIREVLPDSMIVLISAMTEQEHMDAAEQSDIITRFFRKGTFTDPELFRVAVWASLKKLHKEHLLIETSKALHTRSDSMIEFISQLDQVSPTANIMIYGETGTGKELSALRLNANAKFELNQTERPFVAVDCSALATEVLESELFGHVKGAFTGATSDKIGYLARANGGDIFFDEIQNLPLSIQKKLMRAIQEKAFTPVGGTRTVSLEIRIISALNKDVKECLASGVLMSDFVARLRQSFLKIPPLRSRSEDVDMLAELALEQFNGDKAFSADALQTLRGNPWVENVRGFLNTCTSALTASKTPIVTSSSLQKFLPVQSIQAQNGMATGSRSLESLFQDSISSILAQSQDFESARTAFERSYLQRLIHVKKCRTVLDLSKAANLPYTTTTRKIKEHSLVLIS